MKTINLFIILIISTGALLSCGNDTEQHSLLYYYDQTYCSDPWKSGQTADEKKSKLQVYLEKNKIKIISIEVEENPDNAEACFGCHCKTGFRYIVKLDDKFSAKIIEIGFILVE